MRSLRAGNGRPVREVGVTRSGFAVRAVSVTLDGGIRGHIALMAWAASPDDRDEWFVFGISQHDNEASERTALDALTDQRLGSDLRALQALFGLPWDDFEERAADYSSLHSTISGGIRESRLYAMLRLPIELLRVERAAAEREWLDRLGDENADDIHMARLAHAAQGVMDAAIEPPYVVSMN